MPQNKIESEHRPTLPCVSCGVTWDSAWGTKETFVCPQCLSANSSTTTTHHHYHGCPAMTLYDDLAYENGLPVVREPTGQHHLSSNWRWCSCVGHTPFKINLQGGAFK